MKIVKIASIKTIKLKNQNKQYNLQILIKELNILIINLKKVKKI